MERAATQREYDMHEEDDWILWEKKRPINMLETEKQTDGRYANPLEMMVDSEETPFQAVHYTNRYASVVSKLHSASQKAGQFSTWNSQ